MRRYRCLLQAIDGYIGSPHPPRYLRTQWRRARWALDDSTPRCDRVRCPYRCPVLVTLPLALLAVRIQSPLGGEFQFRLSRHLIVIRPACVSKNDKRNMHMTLGNVCRRHVRLGRLMVEAAFPELNSQGMKSLISVRMRTRTIMPTPPMPTTKKTAGER